MAEKFTEIGENVEMMRDGDNILIRISTKHKPRKGNGEKKNLIFCSTGGWAPLGYSGWRLNVTGICPPD